MTTTTRFRILLLLTLSITTYAFLLYKLSDNATYIGFMGLTLSPPIFTLYFITLRFFSKHKTLFKIEKIIWALFNLAFAGVTLYLLKTLGTKLFFFFPSSIATVLFISSAALPFVINIKRN